MSTNTPNYNLVKPSGNPPETGGDLVNVDVINGNMDIIDTALHDHDVDIATIQNTFPSLNDYCAVLRAASQSIANMAWVSIIFDTEVSDVSNMFNLAGAPTKITVPEAGMYLIVGSVGWSANATGLRSVRITKNGSGGALGPKTQVQAVTVAGNDTVTTTSHIGPLAANDYLELQAFQSSGGALGTGTSEDLCQLEVFKLSAQ